MRLRWWKLRVHLGSHLVHAMMALGGLGGVCVSYDYLRHLTEANPLEQYVGMDLDAALEEFFAA